MLQLENFNNNSFYLRPLKSRLVTSSRKEVKSMTEFGEGIVMGNCTTVVQCDFPKDSKLPRASYEFVCGMKYSR